MAARKTSNFVSSGLTTPPTDPAPELEIELGPEEARSRSLVPKEKHRSSCGVTYTQHVGLGETGTRAFSSIHFAVQGEFESRAKRRRATAAR